MSKFTVANVQTNSKRDPQDNIREVSALIREAKAKGADLIVTPEVVGMIEPKRELGLAKAKPEETHEVLAAFRALAAELGVWLLIGSISIKVAADKMANRQFLIDDGGNIVARYSKIHMFDVQVGDGQTYRESNTYRAGEEAVVVETPWCKLGLSICYDIRFPYLYRDLAKAGAEVIVTPAAFTKVTGQAHWHVLQRARAIENGVFIVTAAQTGEHAEGRKTYGHSLVVDPWGRVLSDAGEEVGVTLAEIDLSEVEKARAKVPSLTHDRSYDGPNLVSQELRKAGE
ncbi:MAG: carbon-nitrogen hydrolase family protein [Alphaproteobacteria bacterium]|nr:carbon-nitrogen hydrolase family protein [Alphaproteobacteria bacterium]